MWIAIAIAVVLIALLLLLRARVRQRGAARRSEAWEGVVTDLSRNSFDGQNMVHQVEVRLSDGKTKKLRIPGKLFESLAVGDAVSKTAGSPDPVKK
ncbi:hypothetical protein GCM10022234_10820 [Aeromicrobium panaciterrae]|uniref:DUF7489 domain-containing protein n=1 Tax=Aeromicrobium panaciterrae TaxID=363861 RepID=UPI0031D68840